MPVPPKSETLQKPISTETPKITVKTLTAAAVRAGANPVTAVTVAAEAAIHQSGGCLHNQKED
jgi:hypothetical protein